MSESTISFLLYLPPVSATDLRQMFLRFPEISHLDFVDDANGGIAITAFNEEAGQREPGLHFSLRFLKNNEITMHEAAISIAVVNETPTFLMHARRRLLAEDTETAMAFLSAFIQRLTLPGWICLDWADFVVTWHRADLHRIFRFPAGESLSSLAHDVKVHAERVTAVCVLMEGTPDKNPQDVQRVMAAFQAGIRAGVRNLYADVLVNPLHEAQDFLVVSESVAPPFHAATRMETISSSPGET